MCGVTSIVKIYISLKVKPIYFWKNYTVKKEIFCKIISNQILYSNVIRFFPKLSSTILWREGSEQTQCINKISRNILYCNCNCSMIDTYLLI